jgi:hypothetical protein
MSLTCYQNPPAPDTFILKAVTDSVSAGCSACPAMTWQTHIPKLRLKNERTARAAKAGRNDNRIEQKAYLSAVSVHCHHCIAAAFFQSLIKAKEIRKTAARTRRPC